MSQIVPTSYLIGDGTGKGLPNSDFFVFEADEYRRHFQSYTPDYAVMTNIDFDHPDYFSGIDDVYQAFEDFGKHVKKGVVAWGEDEQLRRLSIDAPVCYYGTEATDDFRAIDIQRFTTGSTFKVTYQEEVIGEFSVPLFGRHGVLNALAVVAIAQLEGLDMQAVKEALETFAGVKRRFSEKHINDVTIIDDYAHHPSEITATLDAARQRYPGREIVAVFQPHTYSRTIAYLDEFAKSLSLADRVYLTDIFGSAREEEGAVSSADLGALINTFGGIVKKHDMSLLLDHSDAVLVFMGAGDISEYEVNYEELLTNTKNSLQ